MTEKIRKEAKEKMLKSLEEKQRKVIEDLESDSEKPKNIRL